MILKDLLKPNLDIVFCDTAVGETSAAKQAYYSGPSNQFYFILYKAGFTPTVLNPEDYKQLLDYNIGLTDLVKYTSGNDNVLSKHDYDVKSLIEKILKYQTKILCFNGKKQLLNL